MVSQSFLRDQFSCRLPSLERKCLREKRVRSGRGTAIIVAEWRNAIDQDLVKNRAELARRLGVSRARVTQALRV